MPILYSYHNGFPLFFSWWLCCTTLSWAPSRGQHEDLFPWQQESVARGNNQLNGSFPVAVDNGNSWKSTTCQSGTSARSSDLFKEVRNMQIAVINTLTFCIQKKNSLIIDCKFKIHITPHSAVSQTQHESFNLTTIRTKATATHKYKSPAVPWLTLPQVQ